jgi:two-component system sensor histidine kinase VicK
MRQGKSTGISQPATASCSGTMAPHHLLAAIVESSDDAIVSKTLEGVITSWNRAAERLYGYRAEEIIGRSVAVLMPAEKSDDFAAIMNQLKQGQRVEHYETQRMTKDGRRLEVSLTISPLTNEQGHLVGASTIARDITQHKRMLEELLFLSSLPQQMADAVIATDGQDMIRSWNDAAEGLYGWKREEVLGKQTGEVLPTKYVTSSRQAWEQHLHSSGSWKGEVVQRKKDGSWVPILSSTSLVKDASGKVIGAVAVNRDITEQKQLEEQKDAFLAMVSHELKAPVTTLKASAQYLQMVFKRKGDPQAVELLAKFDAQVNKLNKLITDFVDTTIIDVGRLRLTLEDIEVNQLVTEIVEEVQRTLPHHRILTELATSATISADKLRLGQVLTNLLSNAIKYSPDADRIVVKTEVTNETVRLCVHDFGRGIPQDKQARLFERFYRVEEPGQPAVAGLGLGLYISAEIVKQHGGTMGVESEPGKGSTFCFTLPRSGSNKHTLSAL